MSALDNSDALPVRNEGAVNRKPAVVEWVGVGRVGSRVKSLAARPVTAFSSGSGVQPPAEVV